MRAQKREKAYREGGVGAMPCRGLIYLDERESLTDQATDSWATGKQ